MTRERLNQNHPQVLTRQSRWRKCGNNEAPPIYRAFEDSVWLNLSGRRTNQNSIWMYVFLKVSANKRLFVDN